MFKKGTLKEDIGLIYLPRVLPSSKTDFVPEGGLMDVATLETIAVLHPLEKCWVNNLAKDLLLVKKTNTGILQLKGIPPKMGHDIEATASPDNLLKYFHCMGK